MKIVLLAGAPGSGKSTQGTSLMEKNPNIKHISIGNVIRKKLDDINDPIAKQYQNEIKSSELLPEEVIFALVKDILISEVNEDTVLLLDGYPRVEAQYDLFKKEYGLPYSIIHLQVDDRNVLMERMKERSSRPDTNEAVINKRLDFHENITASCIDKIKTDFITEGQEKAIITVNTDDSCSLEERNAYIYEQLKLIPEIRKTLDKDKLSEFKLVKTLFQQNNTIGNQTNLQDKDMTPQLRRGSVTH